jgi:hypothetical protein
VSVSDALFVVPVGSTAKLVAILFEPETNVVALFDVAVDALTQPVLMHASTATSSANQTQGMRSARPAADKAATEQIVFWKMGVR